MDREFSLRWKMKFLRWFVLLPTSLICGYAAWVVSKFISYGSYRWATGEIPPSWLIEITATSCMGAAINFVGSKIAPSHKQITSIILSGLILLAAGFLLFPAIQTKNYPSILAGIALILGSCGFTASVLLGEIKLETQG